MPKSRASGTVGSGGAGSGRPGTGPENGGMIGRGDAAGAGAGAGTARELADRLLDRLGEVTNVNVPTYSASRRSTEDVNVTFNPATPGNALVNSASGASYVVDYNDDTCTCPDHRTRGGRCRHIDAVHQAMGQITDGGTAPAAGAGQIDIREAVDLQGQADRQAEAQRQNIQDVGEDDGFFYTDNDGEFQSTLDRVRNAPLQYEYDNVLNGSNITFGLEIEFTGGDHDAIARELYDSGICGYNRRVPYHAQSIPGKWKLERDCSVVDSSDRGGELVSPVLKDTPETWRDLEKICEVARRHGATVTDKTGGHVHVGMDPLDTAKQRWKRFFRTVGGFEDVIYRMAGGSLGRVRSGYSHYAMPFGGIAARSVNERFEMDSMNDVGSLARSASGGNRYYGINLTNIYDSNKPNTVEFRYFNSSLDPAQLQANVKLAGGVMMASEKARTRDDPANNIMPSGTMKEGARC